MLKDYIEIRDQINKVGQYQFKYEEAKLDYESAKSNLMLNVDFEEVLGKKRPTVA